MAHCQWQFAGCACGDLLMSSKENCLDVDSVPRIHYTDSPSCQWLSSWRQPGWAFVGVTLQPICITMPTDSALLTGHDQAIRFACSCKLIIAHCYRFQRQDSTAYQMLMFLSRYFVLLEQSKLLLSLCEMSWRRFWSDEDRTALARIYLITANNAIITTASHSTLSNR